MGDAGDPVVRFERVQKSYDGRTLAVKGVDLTVGRGEARTKIGIRAPLR